MLVLRPKNLRQWTNFQKKRLLRSFNLDVAYLINNIGACSEALTLCLAELMEHKLGIKKTTPHVILDHPRRPPGEWRTVAKKQTYPSVLEYNGRRARRPVGYVAYLRGGPLCYVNQSGMWNGVATISDGLSNCCASGTVLRDDNGYLFTTNGGRLRPHVQPMWEGPLSRTAEEAQTEQSQTEVDWLHPCHTIIPYDGYTPVVSGDTCVHNGITHLLDVATRNIMMPHDLSPYENVVCPEGAYIITTSGKVFRVTHNVATGANFAVKIQTTIAAPLAVS